MSLRLLSITTVTFASLLALIFTTVVLLTTGRHHRERETAEVLPQVRRIPARGLRLRAPAWRCRIMLEELTPGRRQSLPDRLLMLGWTLLEPLGYREPTVIWRLRGIVRYLGKQSDWGTMTRSGFTPQPVTLDPRTAHAEPSLTNYQ
jgi:hypothetical protein